MYENDSKSDAGSRSLIRGNSMLSSLERCIEVGDPNKTIIGHITFAVKHPLKFIGRSCLFMKLVQ